MINNRVKIAGILVAVCNAVVVADVFVFSSTGVDDPFSGSTNPTVTRLFTDSNGFEHWGVYGEAVTAGGNLVLDSDDTNDIIDEVIIYNNGGLKSVTLAVRDTSTIQWERSSLAGISRVKANTQNNTNITLRPFYLDGDILAADPSDAIKVSNIEWMSVGGNIYGHV